MYNFYKIDVFTWVFKVILNKKIFRYDWQVYSRRMALTNIPQNVSLKRFCTQIFSTITYRLKYIWYNKLDMPHWSIKLLERSISSLYRNRYRTYTYTCIHVNFSLIVILVYTCVLYATIIVLWVLLSLIKNI